MDTLSSSLLLLRHYVSILFASNFVSFHFDIRIFLDSNLLSIEDSRLLFIQSDCHKSVGKVC